MSNSDKNKMYSNQKFKLLFEELSKRKVILEKIEDTNIILAKKDNIRHIFIDGYSSLIPYNIGLTISNKNFCREILKDAKLNIAAGALFHPKEKNVALKFARKVAYPVLLRQENSHREEKALLNINSDEEFNRAYEELSRLHENILVEQMYTGVKIMVFITRSGYINVLKVEKSSQLRSNYILSEKSSNLSGKESGIITSNIYRDITKDIHKSLCGLAGKILNLFTPIPYICFEIITNGLDRMFTANSYIISEIYHYPFLHFPYYSYGKKGRLKTSEVFADLFFPRIA